MSVLTHLLCVPEWSPSVSCKGRSGASQERFRVARSSCLIGWGCGRICSFALVAISFISATFVHADSISSVDDAITLMRGWSRAHPNYHVRVVVERGREIQKMNMYTIRGDNANQTKISMEEKGGMKYYISYENGNAFAHFPRTRTTIQLLDEKQIKSLEDKFGASEDNIEGLRHVLQTPTIQRKDGLHTLSGRLDVDKFKKSGILSAGVSSASMSISFDEKGKIVEIKQWFGTVLIRTRMDYVSFDISDIKKGIETIPPMDAPTTKTSFPLAYLTELGKVSGN
ncbi:MAG: hypothetical protein LBG65_06530 [Puniceicoccales bacterium]|jgi:hypothetical protein|nr:hypothetical protein [Puniceicoccales bacterium]